MIADVVVDANIFGHSQNPGLGALFDESTEFLEVLGASSTLLCIDDDDRILSEYESVVGGTGLGAPLLATVLTDGRLSERPGRVPPDIHKKIKLAVKLSKKSEKAKKSNSMDRLYVRVSWSSTEKLVVSHDEQDFTEAAVEELLREVGVEVLYALGCTGRLT